MQKAWPRYKTNTIDDFTLLLERIALEIADAAKKNNKKYMIGSGFAIEFFNGQLSRNHHDVDFHPLRSDAEWWVKWFKNQGYKVVEKQDDEAGKVYEVKGGDRELLVDLWPISEEEWKNMNMKKVNYKGVVICIEDPNRVLDSKVRYARKHCQGKLRVQNLHDFASLGKTPPSKS